MSVIEWLSKHRSAVNESEFLIIAGILVVALSATISGCNSAIDRRLAIHEKHDRRDAAVEAMKASRCLDRPDILLTAR